MKKLYFPKQKSEKSNIIFYIFFLQKPLISDLIENIVFHICFCAQCYDISFWSKCMKNTWFYTEVKLEKEAHFSSLFR